MVDFTPIGHRASTRHADLSDDDRHATAARSMDSIVVKTPDHSPGRPCREELGGWDTRGWTFRSTRHPSPVGSAGSRDPGRDAEGAGEVGDRAIAGDRQVNATNRAAVSSCLGSIRIPGQPRSGGRPATLASRPEKLGGNGRWSAGPWPRWTATCNRRARRRSRRPARRECGLGREITAARQGTRRDTEQAWRLMR